MHEWRASRSAALIGIAVLLMPVPPAGARSVMLASCGGGAPTRIDIPADPTAPDDHDCCRKGCHAVNDRRKKDGTLAPECC